VHSTLLRILTLASVLCVAGCAATYQYLLIHSAGTLGDGLFTELSRLTGPSQMARDLATRIAPAEHTPVRILVSGTDPAKTLQVIRDAFAIHRHSRLPRLEFLFLGEPSLREEVRALVESAGGRMRFAAFEG
jgi:hypothetical protein